MQSVRQFVQRLFFSSTANMATKARKPMKVAETHFVLKGRRIAPPFPAECKTAAFGTGCFWGCERAFWSLPGVYSTAVGYAGGKGEHPTYEEVCTGRTGHNEVALVVYDPKKVRFYDILKTFWECHDPTQINRQGNDRGTQYVLSFLQLSSFRTLTLANLTLTRQGTDQAFTARRRNNISWPLKLLSCIRRYAIHPWNVSASHWKLKSLFFCCGDRT